jgi:hypothetical protein
VSEKTSVKTGAGADGDTVLRIDDGGDGKAGRPPGAGSGETCAKAPEAPAPPPGRGGGADSGAGPNRPAPPEVPKLPKGFLAVCASAVLPLAVIAADFYFCILGGSLQFDTLYLDAMSYFLLNAVPAVMCLFSLAALMRRISRGGAEGETRWGRLYQRLLRLLSPDDMERDGGSIAREIRVLCLTHLALGLFSPLFAIVAPALIAVTAFVSLRLYARFYATMVVRQRIGYASAARWLAAGCLSYLLGELLFCALVMAAFALANPRFISIF